MDKNERRIITNHVKTICMEVIWAILILVGVLVLVAEEQYFCAIMAGIGFAANIIMILTEFSTLKILLEVAGKDSEDKEDDPVVIVKDNN